MFGLPCGVVLCCVVCQVELDHAGHRLKEVLQGQQHKAQVRRS
jgi:hypothetical protein